MLRCMHSDIDSSIFAADICLWTPKRGFKLLLDWSTRFWVSAIFVERVKRCRIRRKTQRNENLIVLEPWVSLNLECEGTSTVNLVPFGLDIMELQCVKIATLFFLSICSGFCAHPIFCAALLTTMCLYVTPHSALNSKVVSMLWIGGQLWTTPSKCIMSRQDICTGISKSLYNQILCARTMLISW